MKVHQIARQRMRNSRLSGTPFAAPEEAVGWHVAMQAQDFGPAKWSIGQRSANIHEEDVDEAVASGAILRTHVLRPTWHFVARADIRWLLALTGPRVQQHNGPRYRELGLDERTRARCEKVIGSALEGGEQLTRARLGDALEKARIDTAGQRLPYILMHCELEAVICSGGRDGKHHTYALLDERVRETRRRDRDVALVELTRRYLASHGPATVNDLRWWSSMKVADIKESLDALGSEIVSETIDDITLWSVVSETRGSRAGNRAHLLQTYDELVVGYTESRFIGDARAAAVGAAWKKRSLPTGIVLVGGSVAGHWRRTFRRDSVEVEVVTYEDLDPSEGRAFERAAEDLGRFLGRNVMVKTSRL